MHDMTEQVNDYDAGDFDPVGYGFKQQANATKKTAFSMPESYEDLLFGGGGKKAPSQSDLFNQNYPPPIRTERSYSQA